MASSGSGTTSPNLDQWNRNAEFWDQTLGEGNDLFLDLILPTLEELADAKPGDSVLDIGTGNGIVARRFAARDGVRVVATDYSEAQIERECAAADGDGGEWPVALDEFAGQHAREFDIITGSMLLKELSDLKPLAEFLPKVLKPTGRVIMANLHPCFHKPGAHRVVEITENPQTGAQEIQTSIKVSRYLNIGPVQSQALRGQPEPLIWFHRPIHELLAPFFDAGLVVNMVREPSFQARGEDQTLAQSYHNFPQIPMQFIFRLVLLNP
ncbi:S-adenosyl-L-methionine-dependent methyltransferase [Cercophora scortea]|uniref:S-adenosyl-L-methionine-dependent methyltransferase n=1 Tax=Cercophora scortea TaxID=314031 RepID=A0AAE0I2Z6_9PEZI|nr:S-adenosyl-L-methionine-dependent methyltransferase [Cercophora scortea]